VEVEASRALELPPLHVVALARTEVRTQHVALDPTYAYFSTLFGGSRRVPRAGGTVEMVSDTEFPPAGVALDPAHAYWNGIPSDPIRTGWVDEHSYGVDATAVYRATLGGPRQELARSFATDGISRKVLVLDDARVFWLEPAASAVLSVPRAGGAVSFVCEAFVPVHYELALSGDPIRSAIPRSGRRRSSTPLEMALAPLRADLAAGKYSVRLSVGAGVAAEPVAGARLDALESWLREHVGTGVHVERTVRASPALDAGAVDGTVYAGLDRRHVPALFAPR
jgi:hypothetical protein